MTFPRARDIRVVLTGTDPEDPRGGIGVAMRGYAEALRRAGLLHAVIPSYRPDSLHGRTTLTLRALPAILREVRRIRERGGRPVVYAHSGPRFGLVRHAMLLTAARAAGAHTVMHLHSPKISDYLGSMVGRSFLRATLLPVSTVCVLTGWWQDLLATKGIGGDVRVVPNPLPPDVEEEARRSTNDTSTGREGGCGLIEILTMTRLVEGKGVDMAIRSLRHLPRAFRLTVAGDGPLKDALESLADRLDLADRVTFAGWVSGTKKSDSLRAADIFCLPSQRDSFGMGFVEAMAHGVPVVALDWGPISAVVPHGRCGVLVSKPSPERVAEGIMQLSDADVRRGMGVEGKQWVRDEFSAEKLSATLRRALAPRRRG